MAESSRAADWRKASAPHTQNATHATTTAAMLVSTRSDTNLPRMVNSRKDCTERTSPLASRSPETSRRLSILHRGERKFLTLWTRPRSGKHSMAGGDSRDVATHASGRMPIEAGGGAHAHPNHAPHLYLRRKRALT